MRARIELLALLVVTALPASAQTGSNAPPMQLGPIPTFANETAAQHGCPGDIVVWADHDTGYFYPKSKPQYGHTPAGAFTCFKSAHRADYWDSNPFSLYGDPKASREFPINPALLDWGS